jgi:hypothetical protein
MLSLFISRRGNGAMLRQDGDRHQKVSECYHDTAGRVADPADRYSGARRSIWTKKGLNEITITSGDDGEDPNWWRKL